MYVVKTKNRIIVTGLSGPDDEIFDDIGERVSAMRRPGEDEMAFYERRYQERVSVSIFNP